MKRNVKLNSFEDLLEELGKIERAKEIKTYGVWSVYQILEHISDNIYGSLHGFPKHQPKIVRMTIGKFMLRKILRSGYMRSGYPNPYAPMKREEGDILSSLQKLRSIIEEFRNHAGSFAMHPIFDKLTGEQWTELHLIHFSMHLGFLEVVEEEKSTRPSLENVQAPEPKKEDYRPTYTISESEIIIEDEDEDPPVNPGVLPAEEKLEIPEQEIKEPHTEKISISEENSQRNEEAPKQEKETPLENSETISKKKPGSKKSSSNSNKNKSDEIESPTPPSTKSKKKGGAKKK